MTMPLGRVGIHSLSYVWTAADAHEAVAEIEGLGYPALWLGAVGDLRLPERLLAATDRLVVATSIVNVWTVGAAELAADAHRLQEAYPGRFLLGLGASHASIVQAMGKVYTRPLGRLSEFLDALDGAPEPVPADRRVLAALGPKALDLAAARSRGAHPYLVTPEYTHRARTRLGAGPLLAPEQKVVLETDPAAARALARSYLSYYLELPNYVRNLRSMGFTGDDVTAGGSDRLVDALFAWGTPEQVAERVAAHHDAGADHVAVQVVSRDTDHVNGRGRPARERWRALAPALLGQPARA